MKTPQKEHYDVVVIGAGIGGLSCAGLLAKSGRDVLLVDQRPEPGGVCFSYQRDGFTIDVGSHLMSGCGEGWYVHNILSQLGVEDQIEFLDVDPLAKVQFPGYAVEIPADYQAFIERLAERFPQERRQLTMLFREMEQMFFEIDDLPSSFGLWDFLKVPVTHPIFMKYPNRTFLEMMNEFLEDDQLKSAVASLWVYFGLPPSEISAVFWTVVMMAYFLGGGQYPRGGIGQLSQTLASGFRRWGGELMTSTAATKIHINHHQVSGVTFEDVGDKWLPGGRLRPGSERTDERKQFHVTCDVVVSNADARQTFIRLVGEEHISPGYMNSLQEMEPSLPVIKVALGVDMDVRELGLTHHDTVYYDRWDMDSVFKGMKDGPPQAPADITVPSITDPGLAPEGAHCVYLWNYAPYDLTDDWQNAGERIADEMISWTERIMPGLREHILFRDITTPETLRSYVGTTQGSPYGWAFTPEQMGFNRLQPRTPIDGLYLTGHWTTPGAGIAGVALSGQTTAKIIQEGKRFSIWRKSA